MSKHMIPVGQQIRIVHIFTCGAEYLEGFRFFDGKMDLIFEIGKTDGHVIEVLIAIDEKIVGVQARIHNKFKSLYTDF